MTVTINMERCVGCDRCVQECPLRALNKGEDNIAHFTADAFCVQCGHCEAVCANNAIQLDNADYSASVYSLAPIPDQTAFSSLVRGRRSTRRFEPRAVPEATIDSLFDVVRFAPTASNAQGVEWLVIGRDRIDRLTAQCREIMETSLKNQDAMSQSLPLELILAGYNSGHDPVFYNAQHLALAHTSPGFRFAGIDSTIALTHLDLALPVFGLGGCWTGIFYLIASYFPQIAQVAGVPDGHIYTGSLMFGFTQTTYHRIPKRRPSQLVQMPSVR